MKTKTENTKTKVAKTKTLNDEAPVEEKFIVLPEKLVQDIMTYLGTKPANETVSFINGVSSTAQYATMQPAPEPKKTESK